jgi:hypothetical protein
MTDQDYLEPLSEILSVRGGFGHREHLKLAWTYLANNSVEDARRQMASAIRHVTDIHGAPDRYHDTITSSWVILVATHRRHDTAATFDQFIAKYPALLDRQLLAHHYSEELLRSTSARKRWTTPDLRSLPSIS